MDLTHHYIIVTTKEEHHREIDRIMLEGRMGPVVDSRGIPMPAWWDEEEENDETMDDVAVNMAAMGSWRGGGQ